LVTFAFVIILQSILYFAETDKCGFQKKNQQKIAEKEQNWDLFHP
jgi:hypothetical protein